MADADLALRDDVEKRAGGDSHGSDHGAHSHTTENNEKRTPVYDHDFQVRHGSVTAHHEGFFSALSLQSLKRNPNARKVTEATDSEGRPLPDQPPAEPAVAMKLKGRHLQMIAIGGSIGELHSAKDSCDLVSAEWVVIRRVTVFYMVKDHYLVLRPLQRPATA
jgi:yeast amino acid transporter